MTLLSTLRPLALRFWHNFWYFLSVYLLPSPSPLSILSLNDDCLLLILAHFTVPELFQLRATSRRLSHLIEQYRLPRIQTLLTSNSVVAKKTGSQAADSIDEGSIVKVVFTSNQHSYTDFCQRKDICIQEQTNFFTSQPKDASIFTLKLSAFPLSLPQLLPRLSSLTFTHFLIEHPTEEDSKKQEKVMVNQIIGTYLRSSWSGTLTSLHLYLVVPTKASTEPNHFFFTHLNKLSSLKHLFLEFTQFIPQDAQSMPLLPDAMPILGQLMISLISFSMHHYASSNTATLLSQLGPNLVFLSIYYVACSIDDYVAFLQAKSPTYRQTLKSLEVYLPKIHHLRLLTAPAQYLPSLERFIGPCATVDILPIFTGLSRLSHLGEVSSIAMATSQLGALHLVHPRPLPKATSITRATIHIFNNTQLNGEALHQTDALFNDYLPLLAGILCSVKYLSINFQHIVLRLPKNEELSERLAIRARELFPQLRHCTARYCIE